MCNKGVHGSGRYLPVSMPSHIAANQFSVVRNALFSNCKDNACAVQKFPYAGITQIRFKGCFLSSL